MGNHHASGDTSDLTWRRHRGDSLVHGFRAGEVGHYSSTSLCGAHPLPADLDDPVPVHSVPDGGVCLRCLVKHGEELASRQPARREVESGDVFPTSRRSIPPVDPKVAELAGQLVLLAHACEEVGAYLPVGRVSWDRLAEYADMLEQAAEAVRDLVERTVPRSSPALDTVDETGFECLP